MQGVVGLFTCISTHTHTRLTAFCPGPPRWAGTRKEKPIWILLKQETVSGSGIHWAICKSASRFSQITMSAPHHFLQAGCPSCRPTNSVKALKAWMYMYIHWLQIYQGIFQWNKFLNRLRFDRIMVMSLWPPFFWPTRYISHVPWSVCHFCQAHE